MSLAQRLSQGVKAAGTALALALTLIGAAANGGELPPPQATGAHGAKPAPGIASANAGKPNAERRSGDQRLAGGKPPPALARITD